MSPQTGQASTYGWVGSSVATSKWTLAGMQKHSRVPPAMVSFTRVSPARTSGET